MKISDELKRRIKQLELEQERQQKDLVELEQLRDLASIEELERELSAIDSAFPHKPTATTPVESIDLSLEHLAVETGGNVLKAHELIHDIDLSLEKLGAEKAKGAVGSGYVVCLVFNASAPSEWSEESGGGWRGKGLGSRYPHQQDAEAVLLSLKQKWPDYPIKILRS